MHLESSVDATTTIIQATHLAQKIVPAMPLPPAEPAPLPPLDPQKPHYDSLQTTLVWNIYQPSSPTQSRFLSLPAPHVLPPLQSILPPQPALPAAPRPVNLLARSTKPGSVPIQPPTPLNQSSLTS